MVRRVAIFLGAFLLFTSVEFALRAQVGPFVNGVLNVAAGAQLINLLSPSQAVRANGDRIESSRGFIQVSQGCEGVDVMFMFVAAMLAMPLGWRRKLAGCGVGVAVIYLANLLRLAGLWYCLEYAPERFEAMHVVVGQTVIIVVAVAVFVGVTGLHTAFKEAVASRPEEIR